MRRAFADDALALIFSQLAVLLLLIPGSLDQDQTTTPSYPVSTPDLPCVTKPCGALQLIDLDYAVTEDQGLDQQALFRFRFRDRLLFGIAAGAQRRQLFVTTARLELSLSDQRGATQLTAGYRGPRWRLRSQSLRRPAELGGGWTVDTSAAMRLNGDLEVSVTGVIDTKPEAVGAFSTRRTRDLSIGILWQYGTKLDLSAQASTGRLKTAAGLELDRQRLSAAAVYTRSAVEVRAELAYHAIRGRFSRSEGEATAAVAAHLGNHLLVHAETHNRWEFGLKKLHRDFRGGFTLFARRHRFVRAGGAALKTLKLVERAYALGYNERREASLDGRRALRERLSLATDRAELADDIVDLYRIQIAERNIPQLGVEVARETDAFDGLIRRSLQVFLGIPWPLDWPTRRQETAVEFLRLSYSYVEIDVNPALRTFGREYGLDVALNRETEVRLRWRRAALTPRQIVFRELAEPRLELRIVYAYGR